MSIGSLYQGKKVVIMGLGLLGRGVGDAKFFAEEGASVLVTDLKAKEELLPTLELLKGFSNISYALGGHRMEDFQKADVIVKNAGVPLDSPYIAEARKNGIPIEMDASLFVKYAEQGVIVIGVTGTRGKTTTTQMIYSVLKKHAKNSRVFLGGNTRGVATLPLVREAHAGDYVVLELDSWQLQGFGESGISPQVSVFTTFLPDHLNYYRRVTKNDNEAMIRYFADKAEIFLHQRKGEICVVGEKVAPWIEKIGKKGEGEIRITGKNDVPNDWKLQVLGEHNRENAGYAVSACRVLGVSEDTIREGIEHFVPVSGRLESLGEKGGVLYINDTTSTTPDSLIASLRAFPEKKGKIVLIAGGADKGLIVDAIFPEMQEWCKGVVWLPGSGTEKNMSEIKKLSKESFFVQNMQEAVNTAQMHAEKGDVIVLSPGFASFGIFKNEYDRGDQFTECVRKII